MDSRAFIIAVVVLISIPITVLVYRLVTYYIDASIGPNSSHGVIGMYGGRSAGDLEHKAASHGLNRIYCALNSYLISKYIGNSGDAPSPPGCDKSTDQSTAINESVKLKYAIPKLLSSEDIAEALAYLHYYGAVKYRRNNSGLEVKNGAGILSPWNASVTWMPDLVLAECAIRLVDQMASANTGGVDCRDIGAGKFLYDYDSTNAALVSLSTHRKKISAAIRPINEQLKNNALYTLRRSISGWIQFSTAIVFIGAMVYLSYQAVRLSSAYRYASNRDLFLDNGNWLTQTNMEGGARILNISKDECLNILEDYKKDLERNSTKGNELAYILRSAVHQLWETKDLASAVRVAEGKLNHLIEKFYSRRMVGRTALQLMPMIGFIGTVYGLGVSMGLADVIFKQDLPGDLKMSAVQGLMTGLSVAFDTTLVSLGLSAVFLIMYTTYIMVENRVLSHIDRRVYDGVFNYIANK